jgi:hypothetical protein
LLRARIRNLRKRSKKLKRIALRKNQKKLIIKTRNPLLLKLKLPWHKNQNLNPTQRFRNSIMPSKKVVLMKKQKKLLQL